MGRHTLPVRSGLWHAGPTLGKNIDDFSLPVSYISPLAHEISPAGQKLPSWLEIYLFGILSNTVLLSSSGRQLKVMLIVCDILETSGAFLTCVNSQFTSKPRN